MNRLGLIFLAIVLGANVTFRTVYSGWGHSGHDADPRSLVRYGISVNFIDYLSYSSWAKQAKDGAWFFSDLYTTTGHESIYFNPFFLVAGKVASALAVSPELVMNIIIIVDLIIFYICMIKICKILKFSDLTAFVVLCLCFGGGGISWLRSLIYKIGLGDLLRSSHVGPDWFYAELYPLSAFAYAPYHATALALMAFLVLLVLRYEDPSRRFSVSDGLLLTVTAMFLAASRPYEPFVLFPAFASYLLLSFISGSPGEARRRRTRILLCLTAGLVPFMAYGGWVSRQPVWNNFADGGLNLVSSSDWTAAFLLLWVLALAGVSMLRAEALRPPYAFFVIWSLICATILLIFNSGLTKLCGGCTIPLSMLAGVVVSRWEKTMRSRRWTIAWVVLLACLAFGTQIILLYRVSNSKAPRVPADLLIALDAIREDSTVSVPTVLTDPSNATYLPGLAGFRVYCGHWALTDDYRTKRAVLAQLGFSLAKTDPPDPDVDAKSLVESAAGLLEQANDGTFQYVLMDKDTVSKPLNQEQFEHGSVVYDGPKYRVVKASPEVMSLISSLLTGFISEKRDLDRDRRQSHPGPRREVGRPTS